VPFVPRLIRRAFAFSLGVVVLAACGGGDGGSGANKALQRVGVGLCSVRSQAAAHPMAAGVTFYDLSHAGLHTLASDLEVKGQRAAAGRVLESMQRVEADIAASPPPPSLLADVERLIAATRVSLDRLSVSPPACMKR
jgi:hypothetical protein